MSTARTSAQPTPASAPGMQTATDPLDVIRHEDAPVTKSLHALLDHATREAFSLHTPGVNPAPLGWPDAVQKIATGVTVTLDCGPTPRQRERHRLRFLPDGTITLLNHHGQHSTDLDLAAMTALHTLQAEDPAEQTALETMHALGARVSSCAMVALWLTGTQSEPGSALAQAGETFEVTTTYMGRRRYGALRNLYAAVAWAQHPFWPRGAGPRFFAHGITPTVLRRWVDAGWTVHDAVDWLSQGVTFPIAEQWRTAGMTGRRAARLAGVGELPDSEAPWLAVGFEVGESDPWRARTQYGQIPRLEPEEAFFWHSRGVRPNSVRDFEALADDEAGAAEQTRKRLGRFPALAKDGVVRCVAMPTRDRALEWTVAGVPSEMVLSWCTSIGTDDTALALALQWCRILPARQFLTISDWNHTHPDQSLQPAEVARLRRLGMATHGEAMGRATAYSSTDLMRPVQMLVAGKRWYGRDLRRALTEAALAQMDTGTGYWTSTAMPEAILAGNWRRVENTLRNIWDGHNAETWRVVLDWLDTNPTPPAPYRTPAVAGQA